jgi:hypothetical protein
MPGAAELRGDEVGVEGAPDGLLGLAAEVLVHDPADGRGLARQDAQDALDVLEAERRAAVVQALAARRSMPLRTLLDLRCESMCARRPTAATAASSRSSRSPSMLRSQTFWRRVACQISPSDSAAPGWSPAPLASLSCACTTSMQTVPCSAAACQRPRRLGRSSSRDSFFGSDIAASRVFVSRQSCNAWYLDYDGRGAHRDPEDRRDALDDRRLRGSPPTF